MLGFARGDGQFTVSRFGRDPGDWALSAYCPENACTPEAAGAVPQLAAGLFWYDEPSGHGLGRRQLALTALLQVNEQGYDVGLQVYDVAFDPTTCTSSLPCPLTLSGLFDAKQVGAAQPWQLSGSAGGPYCCVPPTFSLAAGSFQGLVLNPKDASQIPWALHRRRGHEATPAIPAAVPPPAAIQLDALLQPTSRRSRTRQPSGCWPLTRGLLVLTHSLSMTARFPLNPVPRPRFGIRPRAGDRPTPQHQHPPTASTSGIQHPHSPTPWPPAPTAWTMGPSRHHGTLTNSHEEAPWTIRPHVGTSTTVGPATTTPTGTQPLINTAASAAVDDLPAPGTWTVCTHSSTCTLKDTNRIPYSPRQAARLSSWPPSSPSSQAEPTG